MKGQRQRRRSKGNGRYEVGRKRENLKHFRARRGRGCVRGGAEGFRVEESVIRRGVKEGQTIIGSSEEMQGQSSPN